MTVVLVSFLFNRAVKTKRATKIAEIEPQKNISISVWPNKRTLFRFDQIFSRYFQRNFKRLVTWYNCLVWSLTFPTIRLTQSFSELRFQSHYYSFNCSIDRMCVSKQFLRRCYQNARLLAQPSSVLKHTDCGMFSIHECYSKESGSRQTR